MATIRNKKGVAISKTRVSTAQRKKVFLEAYHKGHGVIQCGLDAAKMDRSTYHLWLKKDPKFALLVAEAGEAAIDFVESKLYQNIDKGREISTIFYLKTRAKHRGYVEASQLDITSGGDKLVFNFGNQDVTDVNNPDLKITDVNNE